MKLRTRLFQLVVGTVVPLLALAALLGWLLIDHQIETFRRGALDRNRAFMTAVDAEVRGHILSLQALASARSLEANDLRAFHRDAMRFLKSQPDWQNVILSTPTGQQAINAVRRFGTPLPTDADAETIRRAAAAAAPAVSGVVLGKLSGKYGVRAHLPVIQGGRTVYVLSAVIKLDTFEKLIAAQHLPTRWVSGLVDASRRFIARVPARAPTDLASDGYWTAVQRADEGWYRGKTVEGTDTFTAHKTSAYTGWSVGLAIPVSVVHAAAYDAAWIMGLGALATLTLALGFAYWMGRRIAVPIGELARAARSLGRDAAPAALDTDAGISEVREVAHALQDAARAIRERQQLIEREQAVLRAADRAKDEFLAMLGHELRNPLGAIATSAHLLRTAEPGDEITRKAQAVIDRQTKHMTRLVEDLLDVSRVAMGKVSLRKEMFDLSQLAGRVARTWEQSVGGARRPISLAAEPAWVDADRARVEQILSNLLDNAHKFSPPGKAVRVSVSRQDAYSVLEVSDEGEGIAPEIVGRVFELFVQGPHGLDRGRGGMGVGLALVKRIAEMHGGTVAAASRGADKGATLTVRLPAAPEPAPDAESAQPAAGGREARRILLIEDNEDARNVMLAMLALEGHSVRAVADGASALSLAREWAPDVLLVDIGLPDMEGYEVARRIRASEVGADARLVAISGYGQPDDERRALQAGFDLHLTKPVAPEVLRHVLSALFTKEPSH